MSNPKKPFNGKSRKPNPPKKPAQPNPGLFLAGFIAASAAVGGALFAANRIDEHEKKKAAERRDAAARKSAAEKPAEKSVPKEAPKAVRPPGKNFKFFDPTKK